MRHEYVVEAPSFVAVVVLGFPLMVVRVGCWNDHDMKIAAVQPYSLYFGKDQKTGEIETGRCQFEIVERGDCFFTQWGYIRSGGNCGR